MEAPHSQSKPNPDDTKADVEPPPAITKKLSRLSINSALSPSRQSGKNYASPNASPQSPSVSRRTSGTMLRSQPDERSSPRRVLSAAHITPPALTPPHSEDKPPMTSTSVSKDYFQKELMFHLGSELHATDTLVLMHDSCYGHRYSRPKTSKSVLNLIVERPERIQAGILGLAAAYVRLGQRHAGGAHPPHPHHEPDSDVPFRIRKTSRTVPITSPIVAAVHGAKWMQELKAMCDVAGEKLANGGKELTRPETPNFAGSPPKPPFHEGDLYLCRESLDAFEGALGGVCEAVDTVFDEGSSSKNCKKAFVCIRPPGHHCSADWPSGFCWINNVHVGIEHAIQNHGLTHAAIIDFDLHHGDGSQAIAWERNARSLKAQKSTAKNAAFKRSSVGYFSIHDINSYPCEDGDLNKVQRASVCIENAHGQNVWNVHLQPWATEAEFWELYERQYMLLLNKAKAYLSTTAQRLRSTAPNVKPKAGIFISAGFDASQWETPSMQRHNVNVPTEFYARMTSDIVKMSQEDGLGTEGRVISVLEGGYSDRALTSGILSHLSGLTATTTSTSEITTSLSGLGPLTRTWQTEWWCEAALRELEDMTNPIPPPPAPVKKWSGPKEVPTYQTPTQSFTAKVVDPTKLQRHTAINMPTPPKSRPQTPLPLDVDWATAAYQLSRLLIPNEDRQVNSCRHDELSEPKKRERHSSIGVPSLPTELISERRQTRGRRVKEDVESGVLSDDRRKTVSELPVYNEQSRTCESNPATMDKASRAPSRTQGRTRQPSTGPIQGVNVPKTRRASLGKVVQRQPLTSAPPVPEIPKAVNSDAPNAETASKDVDALTSGIQKITLKLPNPSVKPTTAVAAPKKTAMKKAPAARPVKGSTSSSTMPKPAQPTKIKQSSSTPYTAPDDAEQLADAGNGKVTNVDDEPFADEAQPQRAIAATQTGPIQSDMYPEVKPEFTSLTTAGEQKESQARKEIQPRAMNEIDDSQDEPMSQVKSPEIPCQPGEDAQLEFVEYKPPQAQSDSSTTTSNFHQEPIQWLPPNTSTPKKMSTGGKENLPIFSATGRIPFPYSAAGGVQVSNNKPDVKQEDTGGILAGAGPAANMNDDHRLNESVWDVPVTPRME